MSVETITGCPISVSVQTLSAWRDATLPSAEQQRLTAHFNGCAACRERLAEYDRLAGALAAIATPPPIGGYGRVPQVGQSGQLQPQTQTRTSWRSSRASRTQQRWRIAGSAGALAAAVLLAFAFVQVFHAFAPRTKMLTTPQPTPTFSGTPQPGPTLAWKAVKLPFAVETFSGSSVLPPSLTLYNFAIAPANGQIAYGCSLPQGEREVDVWATQDGGAHWRLTRIPLTAHKTALNGSSTMCSLQMDGDAPGDVLLTVSNFDGSVIISTVSATLVTFDGGLTWNRLPANVAIFQMATLGATTYAILATLGKNNSVSQSDLRLVVSQDHLHTWNDIGDELAASLPTSEGIDGNIWLNADGSLLVETVDTHAFVSHLWEGTQNGQQWRELPITNDPGAGSSSDILFIGFALLPSFTVQPSSATHPWRMCAVTNSKDHVLICTVDGGKTWQARPNLSLNFPDPYSSTGETAEYFATNYAFTTHGDLVAQVFGTVGTFGTAYRVDPTVYRLTANGSSWQTLGAPPVAPDPGIGLDSMLELVGDMLWTTQRVNVINASDSFGVGSSVAYVAEYPA